MATIRKLISGRWQAMIRKTGEPEQSKTFSTKGEAERWSTEIEARMNRGEFADLSEAHKITIGEALQRYLLDVTPTKKGKEVETYRINALMRLPLAAKSLARFTTSDVAEYKNNRLRQGRAPSTVVKELSLLNHLFSVAKTEWGIHCNNPINSISKPTINNERDRRLSTIEEKYLRRALADRSAGKRSNLETEPITLIALETCMRRSEILSLEWSKIDLEFGVVHLETTKNGDKRSVPLSFKAVQLLMELKNNRKNSGSKKVFKSSISSFEQSFTRTVARARRYYLKDFPEEKDNNQILMNLKFHDTRHEATSRLANVFAMHELMKITGHKDSRMLARYYHPRAEMLADKLQKAELAQTKANIPIEDKNLSDKVEISMNDYLEFLKYRQKVAMHKANPDLSKITNAPI